MKKHKSNITNATALIRAVVGRARAGGFNVSERKKALHFRTGIQQALLRAKELLSPGEYPKFLDDFRRITAREQQRFSKIPKGTDYVSILVYTKPRQLAAELAWVSYILSTAIDSLSEHVAISHKITQAFVSGNHSEALSALDRHEEIFGVSLWSMELRIGLLQWAHGIHAQKAYIAELRSKVKSGMLPYLATFFGRRAEPDVSIGWFLDNSEQKINWLSKSDAITYARFKIKNAIPSNQDELASILRIEQNHNIIDIYETYISVIQNICINSKGAILLNMRETIGMLSDLADFRIQKISTMHELNSPSQKHEPRILNAFDLLLTGDLRRSIRASLRSANKNPTSLFSAFSAALSIAIFEGKKIHEIKLKNRITSIFINALVKLILKRDTDYIAPENSFGSLNKYIHVFNGLWYVKGMQHLVASELSSSIRTTRTNLALTALNSEEVSIFDTIGVSSAGQRIYDCSSLLKSSPSERFCSILMGSSDADEACGIHQYAKKYALSIRFLENGQASLAEATVEDLLNSNVRAVVAHSTPIAMSVYLENENIEKSVRLISQELACYADVIQSFPISEIFFGLEWTDLEPLAKDIYLSNALLVYSQSNDNEKLHSYRCFALETLLLNNKVEKPSLLRPLLSSFEKNEIAFFLGKVCNLEILDMLPSISSTRDALEERREICALLVQSDMDPEGIYTQELVDISRELSVQKGLQTFDGSRIHVDTEALRPIIKRELQESFLRYQSLAKQAPGAAETFEEVLRSISKGDIQSKHLLSIPDSEVDELLVTMILRVRERFLFNIPHGLDSYLSKRVRHGSIVGYIRSPAEREGLITQQGSDGKYRTNTNWSTNIDSLVRRNEIEGALLAFSKSIDQHLLRLKDVILHVKTDDYPLGIFEAPLTAPTYHLIRSVVLRDNSIDGFINTMFGALWGLLMPSLHAARDLIGRDTLRFVSSQFDTLRSKVSTSLEPSIERTKLDMAIGKASASMQAAVESVASWFEPVDPDESTYSADEVVEIAINSVRAIQGEFEPKIELIADESFRVSADNLPILVDIFFIAFGNVAGRSGLQGSPDVAVSIGYDTSAEILKIKVENSVALGNLFYEAVEKVSLKREQIDNNQSLELARGEGGSGLIKLASLVAQSSNGRIEFGYKDCSLFVLELDLSFVALPTRGQHADIDS